MALLDILKGLGGVALPVGASFLLNELVDSTRRAPSSTPPGLSLPPGSVDPKTGAPIPIVPPVRTPYTSPPIPEPTGNQDFAQLGALLRQTFQENRQVAKENREFYPQRTAIDLADFERREAIARANTLERQRERTFRETELSTITAWQKITEANINRDTQLAYGMMNLSATLGMPNPNVLTALSPVVQQAIAAFKPGTPV